MHTAALTKEGKVFTWGLNYYGQLGHGDELERNVPTKVEHLLRDGEIKIVKISCGGLHTAVVTEEGRLLTWCVLLVL